MKITFHIQELGRLKDTSFDLHPLLIFTGDSNLGKSYCAFLVYGFLKSLETELFEHFVAKLFNFNELEERMKKGETVEIVFEMKQLEAFFKENIQGIVGSLIGYDEVNCKAELEILQDDIYIECRLNENGDSFGYSFSGVNIKSEYWLNTSFLTLLISEIKTHINRRIFRSYDRKNVLIFPPARGTILSSTFSVQKAVSANMRMYVEFLKDMDKLREPNFGKTEVNAEIMGKIKDIMEGEIKTRQNEIYYQFDNQSIPITAAASSIKELAPLFLLLKKYPPSYISLLFEEPESHLHPAMQQKLADLLAFMVNQGAFLQITTHSSYLLTEWNNLLRLYFIQQKNEIAFQEILAETGLEAESTLTPESVGAYYFDIRKDGSVQLVKSEITENEQIKFNTFQKITPQMNESRYLLKEKLAELNEKEYEKTN